MAILIIKPLTCSRDPQFTEPSSEDNVLNNHR